MSKPKKLNGLESLGALMFGEGYEPSSQTEVPEPIESGSHVTVREQLRVELDKKGRAGKAVTLVTGFTCDDRKLRETGKEIRTKLGVGGAEKDGELMIQGDHRKRVAQMLVDMGHRVKLIGG